MPNPIYIADYSIEDYPAGAEMVDYNIYSALGIPLVKSRELDPYSITADKTYIVSNATMLSGLARHYLLSHGNYVIIEHDYKIHETRQPHRFANGIFPKGELLNQEFFKKAKAVFLQSNDHLECYRDNQIEANFQVLQGSVFSDKELNFLEEISRDGLSKSTYKFAILDDKGPDKGRENAIAWCMANTIDFVLIPKMPQYSFYNFLSEHPALVYFPNVRESFCRLVVEARCLNMNVIAPKSFGAVKEPWFSKQGKDMTDFLRSRAKINLQSICKYI